MKLLDKPFTIETYGKKSIRINHVKYAFLILFMTSTFTYAEDFNSGMQKVIDIANTTIQSEISALKKRYKDDLNILYEDMSRKGQLNGTPMLDRLSEFCLDEIEDCEQLIDNTLLRVVNNSGIIYSEELASELKYIAKRYLTKEIGNINGYIKQKGKLNPTLETQLAIRETELESKRTNELKKINSEIDLLVISLKNQVKKAEKVPTNEKQEKIPNFPNSSWLSSAFNLSKIIWWVLGILGTIIAGFIIHYFTKSSHQKFISNKGVISQTTINGDVKGAVVKIQGDKVFGNKNVYQGQKPETSLVSYFHDALLIMPELLKDMARALKDEKTKLIREFFVLRNRNVTIGISTKPRLRYFEEDYEKLQNKLDILEDYGFITDVRIGNAPIYRMTPELVQFLLTDIEIT